MKKQAIVIIMIICIPVFICAQEKPTPDEVHKVVSYYHSGKGQGAVLMQLKLCPEIATEEADKNECKIEITNGIVGKGQKVYLWMNYLVPFDDVAEILVVYKRRDKTRKVQDITIPSATRYRLWKSIPTNKTGEWEISIIQELASQDITLGTLKYKVVEDPQE